MGEAMSGRFHFVVSLLPKSMAAKHWFASDNPDGRSVEEALNNCLGSLINQTVPCVIHLIHHELPKLHIPLNRIELVAIDPLLHMRDYVAHIASDKPTLVLHRAKFPTPELIDLTTYEQLSGKTLGKLPDLGRRKRGDKHSKFKVGLGAVLTDPESRFVMRVDHDDLIHRDVAAYCLEHDGTSPGGHTVTSGYAWRIGEQQLREMRSFHQICGSCNAVRISDEEREAWNATRDVHKLGGRRDHWLFAGHCNVFQRLRRSGRDTTKFPFRAGIYTVNTGSNISGAKWKGQAVVPFTPKLREEFGLS